VLYSHLPQRLARMGTCIQGGYAGKSGYMNHDKNTSLVILLRTYYIYAKISAFRLAKMGVNIVCDIPRLALKKGFNLEISP